MGTFGIREGDATPIAENISAARELLRLVERLHALQVSSTNSTQAAQYAESIAALLEVMKAKARREKIAFDERQAAGLVHRDQSD